MVRFIRIAARAAAGRTGGVIKGPPASLTSLQHNLAHKYETFFSPKGLEVWNTYDNKGTDEEFIADVEAKVEAADAESTRAMQAQTVRKP